MYKLKLMHMKMTGRNNHIPEENGHSYKLALNGKIMLFKDFESADVFGRELIGDPNTDIWRYKVEDENS